MTRATIAANFAGQLAALDRAHAGALLSMLLPQVGDDVAAHATRAGAVTVDPGERYAVHRGVAVVPIRGTLTPDSAILERYLGWTTYYGLSETCDTLESDEDVAAVVFHINSPGGLVMGLQVASEAIAALGQKKPTYAIATPMAASAAYWLGCQAGSLSVVPGGLVGCIGVIRLSVWPVQPDILGDQWGVHMSSHARAKDPDPTTDEGMAEIQRSLDESEAKFHAAVAAGRGIDLADLPDRLSVTGDPRDGGAVFWPDDAIARGLADSIETVPQFYDRIFAAHAPKPRPTQSRGYAARAAAAQAIAQT